MVERSVLPMIWADAKLLETGDISSSWIRLASRMASWISPEGRLFLAGIARRNELSGDWRLRDPQISLGDLNPAWSSSDVEEHISSWLEDDILSVHSPMVFAVAFASPAGPQIAAKWGARYLLEGILPVHANNMSSTQQDQYRLNKIINTWGNTSWDINDAHTWEWFAGLSRMRATIEERKILIDAMHERFPELSVLYQRFYPIVDGLTEELAEQSKVYVQLIRGAGPLMHVQAALEIPSLD